MAYKITEYCVKCGSCFFICPVAAISEGQDTYVIDQEKCTQCGKCLTDNHCPAWAIVKE